MLAETLRGVVAQVLLRKSGGGRRRRAELLLGTPAIATIIAEGRLVQLALALESGRRHGDGAAHRCAWWRSSAAARRM